MITSYNLYPVFCALIWLIFPMGNPRLDRGIYRESIFLLGFCSGKSKKWGYQEDIKGISYDMWQCLKIKDLPITLPFIEKNDDGA